MYIQKTQTGGGPTNEKILEAGGRGKPKKGASRIQGTNPEKKRRLPGRNSITDERRGKMATYT